MNLTQLAQRVRTREDFAAFVRDLASDFEGNPSSWDNNDLGSYLEALGAWCQDAEGFYKNQKLDPATISPWRMMAEALLAASIYE